MQKQKRTASEENYWHISIKKAMVIKNDRENKKNRDKRKGNNTR